MNKDSKFATHAAVAMLIYVVLIGGYLLIQNKFDGRITQGWYKAPTGEDGIIYQGRFAPEAYQSPDSTKYNPPPFLQQMWVYPLSIASSLIFVFLASRQKNSRRKFLFLSGATVNLLIFAAFLYHGFFLHG